MYKIRAEEESSNETIYLTTLSVAQTTQRQMTVRSMNNREDMERSGRGLLKCTAFAHV
jgi:hypothetical protein